MRNRFTHFWVLNWAKYFNVFWLFLQVFSDLLGKLFICWHLYIMSVAGRSSEVERSLMVRWVVGSILHGVDPLSYFLFQPLLHDWYILSCLWDDAYKRTLAANLKE